MLPAGAAHYRDTGEALPESSVAAAKDADAILLSAMGLPDVRYPSGTEIVPQVELRILLNLYAGVRPVFALPGANAPLADPRAGQIDFVLVRESTEGLFHSLGKGVVEQGHAEETLRITRATSEKLFDFAFRLAQSRKRFGPRRAASCNCVDKCPTHHVPSGASPFSATSTPSARRRFQILWPRPAMWTRWRFGWCKNPGCST